MFLLNVMYSILNLHIYLQGVCWNNLTSFSISLSPLSGLVHMNVTYELRTVDNNLC